MFEPNDLSTMSDISTISTECIELLAQEMKATQTNLGSVDPFAPIFDLDGLFDEKDFRSVSIQPRPLQDMLDSVIDLNFDKAMGSSKNQNRESETGPQILAAEVLSEVLDEFEDLSPNPIAPNANLSFVQPFPTDAVSSIHQDRAPVQRMRLESIDWTDFNPAAGVASAATAPSTSAAAAAMTTNTDFSMFAGIDEDDLLPTPIAPANCKREFPTTTTSSSVASRPAKRRKSESKQQQQSDSDDSSADEAGAGRFRMYQAEKWMVKFDELVEYKKKHGHCQVPHAYKENPRLARWAKRQRYQYKLFKDGKPSAMTEQRITALEELGFVWDSHSALWEERYGELQEYVKTYGHSNVPSTFPPNAKLAIWVKCQRRQYKLLVAGEASNMTLERIERLNSLNFVWEVRKTGY